MVDRMNNPKLALAEYRIAIDKIDTQIYSLLRARMDIVHNVKPIKEGLIDPDNIFLRVKREVDVVTNAVNALGDCFPKECIAYIWRTLIGASLMYEKQFNIKSADVECYWLAREYFGSFVENEVMGSVSNVIDAIIDGTAGCGAVPYPHADLPDKYWVELINKKAKICAVAPIVKTPKHKPIAFVANASLEQTGMDTTLVVMDKPTKDDVVGRFGAHASVIDEHGHYQLIEVPHYVSTVDDCIIIGAFANQL